MEKLQPAQSDAPGNGCVVLGNSSYADFPGVSGSPDPKPVSPDPKPGSPDLKPLSLELEPDSNSSKADSLLSPVTVKITVLDGSEEGLQEEDEVIQTGERIGESHNCAPYLVSCVLIVLFIRCSNVC